MTCCSSELWAIRMWETALASSASASCEAARKNTRLPGGHPEAFLEAFANVYSAVGEAIRAGSGARGGPQHDYPDVYHGARGVHFIERTVASSRSDAKWTDCRWKAGS